MSKPPKIVVPGLNRGAGIPAGYILGRPMGTGRGPAMLLNLTGLRGMGVATTAGVVASTSDTLSRAHSETVSLSTAVSSGLSGATSSTSSLSSAVSTVDSNQSASISANLSKINSLSTAIGGGSGTSTSLSQISSSLSGAISSTSSLSTAVNTVDSGQTASLSQISSSLSTTNSTNVTQSTSLSQISSSLSTTNSTNVTQSTSLSQISSSLSGAISSTSSLSTAVSTVISGSISAANSRIDSLSTAGGGGAWGTITGTLTAQTDLSTALAAKLPFTVPDVGYVQFVADQGYQIVTSDLLQFGAFFFDDPGGGGYISAGHVTIGGTGFQLGGISVTTGRYKWFTFDGGALEFNTTPYVGTSKIYHEGNLSFGSGLTYTGGVLTATGTGFETLDVDYTDAGNVTTAETDLFTYTITAGKLGANGDRAEAQWSGVFVSSGTATRQLRAYFGGTLIFDSGTLTVSLAAAWDVFCTVTRVSATVVRYAISMTTEGAALAAYTSSGEVTGLTLSNTNILKLTGTAAGVGAATNDIVGKMGNVSYFPLSGGAVNVNQSTSLSQISSSLSGAISSTSSLSTAVSTALSTTNSTNVTQSTSLSQISSSLSGAISSTSSLSTAVSTVDSNQSTSLSQISSSLSGATSSTSSLSSAVSTVDSNQSTSISANLSKINSLSTAIGGGLTAPTIRASKIQSSSAASYALTWPTGAAANDIIVIMAAHGFSLAAAMPSGWIILDSAVGSNWNGGAWAKQLTAADITAGGVTLTPAGTFNGVIAQVCFTGITGDIRQTISSRSGTGGSPRNLPTIWTAVTTDMILAFGSNRNADAPTCDYGSQQQQINAAAASGVLNAASPASNASQSANFTYPTTSGTTGDYQVLIIVKGT